MASSSSTADYIIKTGEASKFSIEGARLKLDNAADVQPLIAVLGPYTSSSHNNPITSIVLCGNTFAAEAIQELSKSLGQLEALTVSTSLYFLFYIHFWLPCICSEV
jgi:Ran GTPase-activating protein (RanGAP) involved in mRNA processing and transport